MLQAETPLDDCLVDILGTLHYMAPEQLEGNDEDARTDLFAFGCVLHEMITGSRAFDGGSSAAVMAAIMTSRPKLVSELLPRCAARARVSSTAASPRIATTAGRPRATCVADLKQTRERLRARGQGRDSPSGRPRRALPAVRGLRGRVAAVAAAIAMRSALAWRSARPSQRIAAVPVDSAAAGRFDLSPDPRRLPDGAARRVQGAGSLLTGHTSG